MKDFKDDCTCGNYYSYGESTKGTVVAAMMPFSACVNCFQTGKGYRELVADVEESKTLAARLERYKKGKADVTDKG